MKLIDSELSEHAKASALPTDRERQAAYTKLDTKIRNRLKLPVRKYYSWNAETGVVIINEKSDRPLPVNKISKSDQVHD